MEKEQYILMFKNDKILSFEVVFSRINKVNIIEELEHFEKAPFNISECLSNEEKDLALLKFFNNRCMPATRYDYEEVLKATGCKDGFELSFKGRGLSLSNHYWFRKKEEKLRYEDINFFTNKWDDSFARAILSSDFEALKKASLNVPDIVTAGWAVKGWLCRKDGPHLYKLGINKGHCEEQLGETLASSLGRRLIGDEVLEYKLEKINDNYASVSKCMIDENEEIVPLSNILPLELESMSLSLKSDRNLVRLFLNELRQYDKRIYQLYVKILVLKTLFFANDFHFNNISIIRNINTGEVKMAPIYDLGGAYGGSENGRKLLSNINVGTLFIVFFCYGMLEPDWDYSWFDSSKLDGFEEEIRETLSKSDFYTPELIENIIDVYNYQKKSIEKMKGSK